MTLEEEFALDDAHRQETLNKLVAGTPQYQRFSLILALTSTKRER
jgi:hypothetical protein